MTLVVGSAKVANLNTFTLDASLERVKLRACEVGEAQSKAWKRMLLKWPQLSWCRHHVSKLFVKIAAAKATWLSLLSWAATVPVRKPNSLATQ